MASMAQECGKKRGRAQLNDDLTALLRTWDLEDAAEALAEGGWKSVSRLEGMDDQDVGELGLPRGTAKALEKMLRSLREAEKTGAAASNPYSAMSEADRNKELLEAAKEGDAAKCGLLAAAKAVVNCRGSKQKMPLHIAAYNGHEAACRVLIEHGADVKAQATFQETPLHIAAYNGSEAACRVLIEHGADVKARDEWQKTPLHHAAMHGKEGACRVLIEHGADVKARTTHGKTPLDMATHAKVAELLRENGAESG